uniref:EF-1-gamma C-terminal domain-containing protein n=1 Tax=Meloidogyne hapla TaxID=6305 RepID=A0A1I8B8J9_MELHA
MPQVYGNPDNFRVKKVLIAAKLANKDIKTTSKAPPAALFPLGLVPALEDGDVHLFGAVAISKYILGNNSQYFPQDPLLEQWLFWSDDSLLPNVLSYVLPSISAAKIDQEIVEKAYQYVLGEEERKKIGNVTRWFRTIINYPGVKEVIGELKFIVKPANFDEKEFEKLSGMLSRLSVEEKTPKEKGKKDKGQKQKEQTPKQEKQQPKKEKKEEEMDPSEEALSAQPKFVDPLATLPKGNFSMDGFKRVYSNEDTATKAIPYFWENFEPENYSIWYAEYKYPEELRLVFMSANLIGGTDNNSTISGIWVWPGQQLAFELCPDWQVDYESYEWKKLDPNDEATKKIVNEYLLWEFRVTLVVKSSTKGRFSNEHKEVDSSLEVYFVWYSFQLFCCLLDWVHKFIESNL